MEDTFGWKLRKVSDFQYYMGGKIYNREKDENGNHTYIDYDKLFLTEYNFYAWSESSFDFTRDFDLPSIVVKYPHSFFYNYSRDFSVKTVGEDDGTIQEIDWEPNYSKNPNVNILMTIIKDIIPHLIPVKHICNGKPGTHFRNNEYLISLYEYGFNNIVYGYIDGKELMKYEWWDLDFLNFSDSPADKYLCRSLYSYNGKKRSSDEYEEEFKKVPGYIWEGYEYEFEKGAALFNTGISTSADLIYFTCYGAKGKGGLCKHIYFLNTHTNKIELWTREELLALVAQKKDLRIENVLGKEIVVNVKAAGTRSFVFLSEHTYSQYSLEDSPYQYIESPYPMVDEYNNLRLRYKIETDEEYAAMYKRLGLPKYADKYYSKESIDKRQKLKFGALWSK